MSRPQVCHQHLPPPLQQQLLLLFRQPLHVRPCRFLLCFNVLLLLLYINRPKETHRRSFSEELKNQQSVHQQQGNLVSSKSSENVHDTKKVSTPKDKGKKKGKRISLLKKMKGSRVSTSDTSLLETWEREREKLSSEIEALPCDRRKTAGAKAIDPMCPAVAQKNITTVCSPLRSNDDTHSVREYINDRRKKKGRDRERQLYTTHTHTQTHTHANIRSHTLTQTLKHTHTHTYSYSRVLPLIWYQHLFLCLSVSLPLLFSPLFCELCVYGGKQTLVGAYLCVSFLTCIL